MLCIEAGVQGLQTAKLFGRRFEVPSTIVNAYIDQESEVPKFGQLGCGGFIVLGLEGELVTRRSAPSYLKKGPGGFLVVEQILSTLGIESPASRPLPLERHKGIDSEQLQLAPVGNVQM